MLFGAVVYFQLVSNLSDLYCFHTKESKIQNIKRKNKIMKDIIKGALLFAGIAAVGTGGYFGYKKVSDNTKEITQLKTELTQEKENSANTNKLLEEKTAQYSELKKIYDEKVTELDTVTKNVATLESQKASLLNAVTEIDNTITKTTDKVELENLQTRKTVILAQITTLEENISTLNTDKTKLEDQVKSLQEDLKNITATVNGTTITYKGNVPALAYFDVSNGVATGLYENSFPPSFFSSNDRYSSSDISDVLYYSFIERIVNFNNISEYSGDYTKVKDYYLYELGLRNKGITIGSIYQIKMPYENAIGRTTYFNSFITMDYEKLYNFASGTNAELAVTLDGETLDISDLMKSRKDITDSMLEEMLNSFTTAHFNTSARYSLSASFTYELNESNEVTKFVINVAITANS